MVPPGRSSQAQRMDSCAERRVGRRADQRCVVNGSGGGGIRTRGPRERTPVFKTGAFDRSATPPVAASVTARSRDRLDGHHAPSMAVAREGHPHLPPGREPGPQSRRTSTGRTLGGCAAPAFVVAGVVAAAIVAGFGLLLGSLPAGRRRGRSSSAPWRCSPSSGSSRARCGAARARATRPASSCGSSARSCAAATASRRGARLAGEGELEVGLVCTQSFDVWRRIGDDSRSRVTDKASSGSSGCRRRTPRSAGASSSRCRPRARTPTRATASRWLGGRRAPRRREARGRARAAVGGAVRLRVEVDGEPLAPGAAVSGRVVVEEGGGARSLSVRLAFVERTAELREGRARRRQPGPRRGRSRRRRRIRLPARAPRGRPGAGRHRARAHRLGGRRPRRSRRAGPHRRPADRAAPGLHCPRPGEVAEWLKALAC